MKRTVFLTLIIIVFYAAGAAAQIPRAINYQGVLTDNSEIVVPDGSYELTLRLYTVPTGGSPIWSCVETVTVSKGIFNAVLGGSCALNLDFSEQYYLGISVEGEAELSPRTPLTSAAYSLAASRINGAGNVMPSQGDVGIGITTPSHPLHIQTSNITGLQIDGTAGGAWAVMKINAAGSGSNPAYEYLREGSYRAMTYVSSGDDWNLRLAGTDVLTAEQPSMNIGIGVPDPEEKLTVNGGIRIGNSTGTNSGTIRWTGSDFEGYDGGGWQSLTGGAGSLPAGTSGQTLRHDGADWVPADNLTNDGSHVGIGSESIHGYLDVYYAGSTDPVVELSPYNTHGGRIAWYDETGNRTASLEPDIDGEGAYLDVKRNSTISGFAVDGNYIGSGNPAVNIIGSSRSASFNMNNSGDQSVSLPNDAISAFEILNETGGASYEEGANSISLSGLTTIASQSITAPAAGYVLVIGSFQARATHTNGTDTSADFGVSDSDASLPNNQDLYLEWPSHLPSSSHYSMPVTVHSIFEVPSDGSHTFYLLGDELSGDIDCFDMQLSIIYFPTSYGTVMSPAPAGDVSDDDAATMSGLTADFVENQRTESIEANNTRIRKEIAEMRSRLEKLERMLEKGNK